jgi:outer membrane protein assembly factor BamE (lipoprotein component of BamABCDE complex)
VRQVQIMKNKLMIAASFLLLSSCTKGINNHGFNFENTDFESIKVAETSRLDVKNMLGSPTSESSFGPKKYYYISYKTESVAFLEPKQLEQKVLTIVFNHDDIVSDIEQLTLDDANKVIFAEHKTEIKGNTLSPLQQIMSNVGKFNKNKR